MSAGAALVPSLDRPETADDAARAELLAQGYLILRQAIDPATIAQLDEDLADDFAATPASQGPFYGEHTVRFGGLLARSAMMQQLVMAPRLLALAEVLLRWHQAIQLDFTHATGVRPGAPSQVPHRDGEMWPLPGGAGEHLVNMVWPLTPFLAETGATQVWPRIGGVDADRPVVAEMMPGDVLVFLGSTRHRQGANRSDQFRRGVIVGYSAAWLKPSENQLLSYPPHVARHFPPALRDLIGYRRLAPNLNNLDCRCPSELFGNRGRGAIDQLFDHQPELIRAYRAAYPEA